MSLAFRRCLVPAFVLLVVPDLQVSAQALGASRAVETVAENDLFLPRAGGAPPDYDYTHGTRAGVTWASAPPWVAALARAASSCRAAVARATGCVVSALGVTQDIYTPRRDGIEPVAGERPYAGWLELTATVRRVDPRVVRSLDVVAGVTGHPSLAEDAQMDIHRLVRTGPQLGWRHQLPARGTLGIRYGETRRFERVAPGSRSIAARLRWNATAGNAVDALSAGGDVELASRGDAPWSPATADAALAAVGGRVSRGAARTRVPCRADVASVRLPSSDGGRLLMPDARRTWRIAAIWLVVALGAAAQTTVLARATETDLAGALARRLAILPLWMVATPLILWSARRWPPLDGERRPVTSALALHIASGAAFVVLANMVIRAPLLLERGLTPFARSTMAGLAEYLPAALAVYLLVVLVGHLSSSAREAAPAEAAPLDCLAVRQWDRVHLVRLGDIEWIEAEGNYVVVHANGKRYRGRERIGDIAERLDEHRFVRIHRSTIVPVANVREVQPLNHGDHAVILRGGKVLRVARSRREVLERAIAVPL